MKLWSHSLVNGEPIAQRHAAGRPNGSGGVSAGQNISPHLAWTDLPAQTRSLVLICHDFDVPSRSDDLNRSDREVPVDLPRIEFFHWLLVDLPPSLSELAEGQFGCGLVAGGKPGPLTAIGARQGLNDYTGWFANDPAMAGEYFGYDGPCPPFNDSLVHHYLFTLYALSLPRLGVQGHFNGAQVRDAMAGLVLGAATLSGTYTLNPRLLGR